MWKGTITQWLKVQASLTEFCDAFNVFKLNARSGNKFYFERKQITFSLHVCVCRILVSMQSVLKVLYFHRKSGEEVVYNWIKKSWPLSETGFFSRHTFHLNYNQYHIHLNLSLETIFVARGHIRRMRLWNSDWFRANRILGERSRSKNVSIRLQFISFFLNINLGKHK